MCFYNISFNEYFFTKGEFDFAKCFSTSEPNNHDEAEKLMSEVYSENINTADVFKILRNKDCKICHSVDDQYPTQGSQVTLFSLNVECFLIYI